MGVILQEPEPWVIEAAKHGDMAAFESLVRMYQPYVWRLTVHLLRDEQTALDATQDAFLKVFRSIAGFKSRSKFSTWVVAIARNCAHDELRKRTRRARLIEATSHETTLRTQTDDTPTRLEIRDAITRLPLELREPVILVDMLGFSYHEAALTLRVNEGTIKSRLHRARAGLIAMLAGPTEDANEG